MISNLLWSYINTKNSQLLIYIVDLFLIKNLHTYRKQYIHGIAKTHNCFLSSMR